MLDISHIHFHDTQIWRVVEDAESDTLTMEVNYPVDWQNNTFEPRMLVFENAYNYQVHEMPFVGPPTILDVEITGTTGKWSHVRLETNAGWRSVSCVALAVRA